MSSWLFMHKEKFPLMPRKTQKPPMSRSSVSRSIRFSYFSHFSLILGLGFEVNQTPSTLRFVPRFRHGLLWSKPWLQPQSHFSKQHLTNHPTNTTATSVLVWHCSLPAIEAIQLSEGNNSLLQTGQGKRNWIQHIGEKPELQVFRRRRFTSKNNLSLRQLHTALHRFITHNTWPAGRNVKTTCLSPEQSLGLKSAVYAYYCSTFRAGYAWNYYLSFS